MRITTFFALSVLLTGCPGDRYEVRCEAPYYSGPALRFAPQDGWTLIETPDGTVYYQSGSVKCEAKEV